MVVIFWVLALLALPVGIFISFVSYLSHGLGLYGSAFGEYICIAGMFSVIICIICVVLGIIKLRKGDAKKAVIFAAIGIAYAAVIVAGFYIDEAVDTVQHNKAVAERNEEKYGENWNDAPAINDIPELYQEVLNKFYAVVRDRWAADELMDLGAVSMADYYGNDSLESIGFLLMDLNGDNVDELIIGNAAAEEGTEIFCIYSDIENPHYSLNSVEGQTYYLHPGEAEGEYCAEILERDTVWQIKPAAAENVFDFSEWDGTIDVAERIHLELIPFSQYK